MLSVGHDLRYAARLLRKSLGSTIAALLALALGMGAASAIFSVVDAVLLKPLPFRDPQRLVIVWEKNPAQNKFRLFAAVANFREWQRQSHSFQGMAAIVPARVNLTGGPHGHIDPEELRAERVSAALFPLLGVQAVAGRTFRGDEDQPGHANFVLLSHALWTRRFGADPAIVGKAIRLRDRSYTVVGVLPRGFERAFEGCPVLDPEVDVWLPLGINLNDARIAGDRNLVVVARFAPATRIEQARSEMETIGDRLERAYPALNAGWRPSLVPLEEELVGKVRRALQVMLAAVAFLLLMACGNVANLLLVRAATRRKEIAVRCALGAGTGRIVAQLLAESLLLSLTAGALGLVLAWGALATVARLGPAGIPRLAGAQLDFPLFAFAFAVSVLTGVLFGLAPAVQVANPDLRVGLAEGGRGGKLGRSGLALRNGLVVTELALAVVLLIGAGLLVRSFVRLRAADPGFQPAGLLTARVPLTPARSSTPDRRLSAFHEIAGRLAALPGVRAVGAVSSLPLTGLGVGDTFGIEGRPTPPRQGPICLVRAVTPEYFRVMGIPLHEGREFSESDSAQVPRVVVVNEALASRFWLESALGGRVVLANLGGAEIVGVVGNVKADRPEADDWPTIYYPYAQLPYATMTIVLRTAVPPLSLAPAVERAVHQFDPNQPLADVRTMESVASRAVAGPRFNTLVLAFFAVTAFALAAVGIYGVMAYDVTQRTQEIGIRMALGAQSHDVLKLVLGQGARLAAFGIGAGLAAALGLTRLMAAMLYGVQATDALTFAFIGLLLLAVALLASYLPSRRAMALDPVTALRHE